MDTILNKKTSVCQACKFWQGKGSKGGVICKAFPHGIPFLILSGEFDHRKKYPGQENDIVFKPKTEE